MMSIPAQRLIALMILVLGLFLGSTFDTQVPVILATVLTLVIVLARVRRLGEAGTVSRTRFVRWALRGAVGLGVIAIILVTSVWRIGSQVGESFNPVSVGIEVVAHSCFFVTLVAWALRPTRGHISMLPLGLFVVLLCVAGGGASLSLNAQTTVALAACLGFTIASQIILGIRSGTNGEVFARPAMRGDSSAGRTATSSAVWIGPAFSLLTLSILMMATTAIASATNRVLPTIQDKLQEQLESSLDPVSDQTLIGGTGYVSGTMLGSIRGHILNAPQGIALRIHSDLTPGYLRGTVFDVYRRRRWHSAGHGRHRMRTDHPSMADRAVSPGGPAEISLNHPPIGTRQRFPLVGSQRGRTVNLEIHTDPLKGKKVFLPLNTRWLEAVSSELMVSSHGIVRIGVDVRQPYVAGVALTSTSESLDPVRRRVLLQVPDFGSDELRQITREVCSQVPTTRGKAEAVSKFFQTQFAYSLDSVDVPERVDPLEYFLETKHAAHCEYFASATVLVLRSAGIPARYVTGYVADEFDDELTMWVARNRDAHAWAEAYDDATGQWFPVESTPGRRYQTVNPDEELEEATSLFDVFRGDDDEDDDTFISRAVGWFFSLRATDPLFVVFRIAQLPLFFVLVFFLWSRLYRRAETGEDLIDQQSRKMLRKVDRRLEKYLLVRRPSETLYQFADRIDAHSDSGAQPIAAEVQRMLAEVSQWYRQYANARYQGEVPAPPLI